MSLCARVAAVAVALAGMSVGDLEAAEAGFYVGAAIGQAGHDVEKSDGINIGISGFGFVVHVDPVAVETEEDVTAWDVTLGYRMNQYFAAELSYMDFGDVDVTEHYDTAGLVPSFPNITRDFNVAVAGPVASVLGSIPVGAGFELHARIGYLFAHQELEEVFSQRQSLGNEAWIGGVGTTWSFAGRWAVRLEYLRTSDLDAHERLGQNKIEMLNLGALFRL
jgi:opacity protein-like surface antigen